jgi:hypothetical protein
MVRFVYFVAYTGFQHGMVYLLCIMTVHYARDSFRFM